MCTVQCCYNAVSFLQNIHNRRRTEPKCHFHMDLIRFVSEKNSFVKRHWSGFEKFFFELSDYFVLGISQ